jgi:hypothetical protein
MAKHPPGVTLEPLGNGYVLRRTSKDGKTGSLRLSREEATSLIASTPVLRDRLLSARSGDGGGLQVVAVPVDSFQILSDALGEDVLLTLGPPEGHAATYVLTLAGARALVEGFRKCFADTDSRRLTKQ